MRRVSGRCAQDNSVFLGQLVPGAWWGGRGDSPPHCTRPSFPGGAQASSPWLEFPGSLPGLRTVLAMVPLLCLPPWLREAG